MYNDLLHKINESAKWDLSEIQYMNRVCRLADRIV